MLMRCASQFHFLYPISSVRQCKTVSSGPSISQRCPDQRQMVSFRVLRTYMSKCLDSDVFLVYRLDQVSFSRSQILALIGLWCTTRQDVGHTLCSFRKGNLPGSFCEDRTNESQRGYPSSSAEKSQRAEDSTHHNSMGHDSGNGKLHCHNR